jgi:mono/diheme cytochrome c family protein
MLDGRQYVAFDSGNVSRTIFGAVGRPSVIVMQADIPTKAVKVGDDTEHGREVYQHNCLGCHATDGTGITGFSLRDIKARMSRAQLIEWIRNPRPPMPRVFPEPLDANDLRELNDLAAYIEQW